MERSVRSSVLRAIPRRCSWLWLRSTSRRRLPLTAISHSTSSPTASRVRRTTNDAHNAALWGKQAVSKTFTKLSIPLKQVQPGLKEDGYHLHMECTVRKNTDNNFKSLMQKWCVLIILITCVTKRDCIIDANCAHLLYIIVEYKTLVH